jgi:hypothetical protein
MQLLRGRAPRRRAGVLPLLLACAARASPAALDAPPTAFFPGVNAAFALDMGPRGPGAGHSAPFVAFVAAGVPSLAACAAAAAAWRNVSAPPAGSHAAVHTPPAAHA